MMQPLPPKNLLEPLSQNRNMQKFKQRKLILVIGPESSGTRFFTAVLSQHPLILGTPQAQSHFDVLDEVWQAVNQNDFEKAIQLFPDSQDFPCILTRRSMPHSRVYGEPALYMDFSNLTALKMLCELLNLELILLITSRSPSANLASWTLERLSADRSLEKAMSQYQAVFCYLFDFIKNSNTPFLLLTLEALVLDGQDYIQSIFQLLGLPQHRVQIDLRNNVNNKRYEWYFQHGLPMMSG